MPNNLSKDSSRFAPAHCMSALQQTIPNTEKRSPDFGLSSSQAPRAHPGGEREAKGMPLSGNLLLVLFGLYNKRSPWAIWTRDEIRPADFLCLSTGLSQLRIGSMARHWIPRPVCPIWSHKYRYVFLAGFRPPRHPHPPVDAFPRQSQMPILYRRFAHERGEAGVGILYCLDTLTPSPEASLGCSVPQAWDAEVAVSSMPSCRHTRLKLIWASRSIALFLSGSSLCSNIVPLSP